MDFLSDHFLSENFLLGNYVLEEQLVMIFRIFLAATLGGVVGYEREMHNRWAGFRTHILVCVGACLIMVTSIHLSRVYAGSGFINADPGRLAAQVVSGIGFLGAGTILHSSSQVRGLTTAANLWMIAGVGLAVGSGLYLPAIVTTALAYVVLEYFGVLETRFKAKSIKHPWMIDLVAVGSETHHKLIFEVINDYGLVVQTLKVDNEHDGVSMNIEVRAPASFDQTNFLEKLRQLSCVSEAGVVCLKKQKDIKKDI